VKKGIKLYSILKHKCPRCHEGDMFLKPGEKNYNFIGYTPERCKVCGQPYVLEPGFYYGAMYISYMLSVVVALPQFIIYYAGFDISFRMALLFIIIAQIILTPFIYRTSRSLWINVFVSYDADFEVQKTKL
jgi:uncharacterized protein (DUF983 family)